MRVLSRRGFLAGSVAAMAGVAAGATTPPPAPGVPAAPAEPLRYRRVVDLTHTLTPDFPTGSGQVQLTMERIGTRPKDQWNMFRWHVHEHTGTHLDAPLHRSDRDSADLIPAAHLVGPLAVLDIRAKAATDADAQLTLDDLKAWEARHGPVPAGAIVAMNSGWDALVRTPRFRGADSRGTLHAPGFHVEVIDFLLAERDVKGIVVDTLSLDPGISGDFPVHSHWLGSNRWGLECAAHLGDLPATGATLVVGAPKIAGASGGPSRVFALL